MGEHIRDDSITVIRAKGNLLDFRLKELIKYRDLIWLFVKRNYSTRYKQTILGSAWLIINPICTVVMNTIVFGGIAGLSTDGVPKPLFYLAGNIIWALFAGCLNDSANTFVGNAGLYGKIYFPRLVNPISNAITQMGDFLIKLALLLILCVVYFFVSGYKVVVNAQMLLLPVLMIQISLMGIGTGIIISSFTTKYRDLQVLVGFGMSIWMYLTPIVYTVDVIPEKYMNLYMLNPVTPIVLIFKKAFLGTGQIPWSAWGYSWIFTALVVFVGIIIFNHVERTFMDTV